MPTPTAVPSKVSGDNISLTNWTTHLQGNLNYLLQQGSDLVAASPLGTPTNIFHKVTGSTGISSIPILIAGTRIKLWFTGAPIITHTASGGAANTIVLQGGVSYQVVAQDVLEFVSDGTQWRQVGKSLAAVTTYRKTTAKDLVSSNTYTDLLNGEITVAAGALGANGIIRAWLAGDYLNNSGSTRTVDLGIALGGTTLWRSGVSATTPADADRVPWFCNFTIQALAATNSQYLSGLFGYGFRGTATTGIGTFVAGGTADIVSTAFAAAAASVKDTTAALALTFSAAHSASDAALSMRLLGAYIEVVNP